MRFSDSPIASRVAPLLTAALAIVLWCAASAQAHPPRRLTPGVRAAAPTAQALSQALGQATGLSPSQVTVQDSCPPVAAGYARCSAQVLVLRSDGSLVRPYHRKHPSLGRVKPALGSGSGSASPATGSSSVSPPQPFTPGWLEQAYDLAYLSQNGGTGDTVAIVDAFNDPNAASDLATYRSTYGLPACTTASGCLQQVNESGAPSPLPTSNVSWEQEESLDLDAVSAVCPNCKILLVEANSAKTPDLDAAMETAQSMGADQISDSWTVSATSPPSGTFTFPGVATVAATGDAGYVGAPHNNYPAAFPGVTAAGGTDLTSASSAPNARGFSEGAWSLNNGQGGGSGCDTQVAKPSYQTDTGCTGRSYATLSADADPSTGLEIYDTANGGWLQVGGTSLATPIVAAYYAISGVTTGSPQWAYTDSGTLNDIVTGSNGTCPANIVYICNAGVGYDGPTGVGSISGAAVSGAPGIGGPAIISGSTNTYTAAVRSRGATIDAGVYPNGLSTTWWIQYGTTTSYGSQTPPANAGSGTSPASVTGYLSQLSSNRTFHYRVVAENADGTTYGYDYTLTTLPASSTTPTSSFAFSPTTPTPASSVSFNASGSTDSGASITDYRWDFGDGSTEDTGNTATASHTYASLGTYNVTLIVTNANGQSDSITHVVTVDQPQASFTTSPTVPAPGSSATFNASGSSDPEGTITGYSWNFGDGNTSTSENPTHAYTNRGTYTVTLTVTNNFGQTNTTTESVTVDNPPTAAFTASPPVNMPHTAEAFDGSASTPGAGGTIHDYSWNFGDGATQDTGTTAAASHQYAAAGVYTVTLTVTDDLGVTNSTTQVVTVDQPQASFTTNPTVPAPGTSASFNASGSTDPEGTITGYSWNFGDGNTSTSENPTHTYAARGTYTVTLTITNNYGQTNTATEPVAVDNPPTAAFTATPNPIAAGSPINFDGSGSTAGAGGTIQDYSWNFGDGPIQDTGTNAIPNHTYASPGVYPVTLTVRDDLGVTNSITEQVTADAAPAAAFTSSPNPDAPGGTVAFNGSDSTDSVGSITDYTWNFGDGTAPDDTGTTPTTSHPFARGTYIVTLTVTNDADQTVTSSETVTVDDPPTSTFAASPTPTTPGTSVNFVSSASSPDPGGYISNYSWSFGDGATGAGANPSHAYASPGVYTATLTVTDDLGLTSSVSHQVTVDSAPAASVAIFPSPAIAGSPVAFDASGASDSVGTITGYSWNFGDGSMATGPSPSHVYADPGTYTVALNVTNDAGQTNTATRTLTVYGTPSASFTASPNPAVAGSAVSFSGSGSSEPGGVITGYSWNFGDGTTASGANPTHAYATPGTYTVTLTVTGSGAQTASTSQTVVIDAPAAISGPPALSGRLTAPKTQKLASVLKHGLQLNVSANRGSRASIQVTMPAAIRHAGDMRHPAAVTLLSLRGRMIPLGTHQLTLKLSRAAQQRLSGKGPILLTVRITLTDASGGTVTRTTKLTVQR